MKIRSTGLLLITFVLMNFRCTMYHAKIEQIENGVRVEMPGLNVKVQFYSDDIVRVLKWLPASSPDKLSLVVNPDSLVKVNFDFEESSNAVRLTTGKINVRISKADGGIEYFSSSGQTVLKEKGQPVFTPVEYAGDKGYSLRQNFTLATDEGIYGLGQHQDGYMNYRGKSVTLVQSNTDAVTPFLISTRGYGIFWDNYAKTIFEDNANGASWWSDIGDNVDYYFIFGKNLDGVIAGYRDLTGRAPLYGKWAYGYWQSKEHYDDRNELLSVAKKYRERKIPIDNIVQDWDYWDGRENWSQMFFDAGKFPNAGEMVAILHKMNYHMMISIWPGLGPNTAIHKDMAARRYLFNTVGWASFKYYDAFIPAANDLYWDYLKKGLYSKGIDAWWIDSTEPDIVNATTKAGHEYEMKKVGNNHLGSWARYLNAYSLAMMDRLYENQRKVADGKRVYMLTRSVFAGQQRTAATTWSGDIGASWEVYKKQITAGINFSMAGIPYWTFDIGGFVLGAYDGVFSKGGKDPAYQELYARMFQFGAFCPIFRSHGSETPREIWEFGEFVQPMLKFNNLRYRLLPYIYSLAWQVTDGGYTMMRGLPVDFTADRTTYTIDDQYMFGPALMVCPVTEYQIHRPPEKSIIVTADHFRTNAIQPGLLAKYYRDPEFQTVSREQIEPDINHVWYTGRPDYLTDSTFAARWQGKLIPTATGKHQFHLKSFDRKRIILNGRQLPFAYTSTEQYTDIVELEAGREYDFVLEMENRSTGAAKMQLFWKTPEVFARESAEEERAKSRPVYLPAGSFWVDFWTGATFAGGQTIAADAPMDKIPLLIKAGSVLPMGPFLQYATEKPADPLELRIYPGADASFTLYEDENDNYNYEKGVYATIDFHWDDAGKKLTIADRTGKFPGMLEKRKFNVVLVTADHGTGVDITGNPDKVVEYDGNRQVISL